jgi:hypothetical protein
MQTANAAVCWMSDDASVPWPLAVLQISTRNRCGESAKFRAASRVRYLRKPTASQLPNPSFPITNFPSRNFYACNSPCDPSHLRCRYIPCRVEQHLLHEARLLETIRFVLCPAVHQNLRTLRKVSRSSSTSYPSSKFFNIIYKVLPLVYPSFHHHLPS